MATKSRLPRAQMRLLKEAMRAATMEEAGFGFSTDKVSLNGGAPVVLDDFVKAQVKLYMRTWVNGPLGSILNWAEN